MAKTERLNVYVVPGIKEYVVKECEELGMSQSAFVTMVINQYRQQKDSLNTMNNMLIQLENRVK